LKNLYLYLYLYITFSKPINKVCKSFYELEFIVYNSIFSIFLLVCIIIINLHIIYFYIYQKGDNYKIFYCNAELIRGSLGAIGTLGIFQNGLYESI
jgi:hypothetical protein